MPAVPQSAPQTIAAPLTFDVCVGSHDPLDRCVDLETRSPHLTERPMFAPRHAARDVASSPFGEADATALTHHPPRSLRQTPETSGPPDDDPRGLRRVHSGAGGGAGYQQHLQLDGGYVDPTNGGVSALAWGPHGYQVRRQGFVSCGPGSRICRQRHGRLGVRMECRIQTGIHLYIKVYIPSMCVSWQEGVGCMRVSLGVAVTCGSPGVLGAESEDESAR